MSGCGSIKVMNFSFFKRPTRKYVNAMNGQILDWDKINALTFKFVEYFEKRDEPLYITKLLKLFFYFDFISHRVHAKPFTGDVYFKLPYGPIPSFIKEHLDLLKEENDENAELEDFELTSVFAKYFEAEKNLRTKGYIVRVRDGVEIPRDKFDDYFSEWDNKLFSDIVEVFKGRSVREVVEMTHRESPYTKNKRSDSVIDYLVAFDEDFPEALPHYRSSCYSG